MTICAILEACEKRKISLAVDGDKLRVSGETAALTPDLRAAIAERKQELLMVLDSQRIFGAVAIDESMLDKFRAVVLKHLPAASVEQQLAAGKAVVLDIIQRHDADFVKKAHAAYCYWRLKGLGA